MAKRLIEEGNKAWNLISQNKHQVPWESVVYEIEEQFMKVAACNSRALTQQVPLSLSLSSILLVEKFKM